MKEIVEHMYFLQQQTIRMFEWLVREKTASLIIFGALLSSMCYDLLIFPTSPFNKLKNVFFYLRIVTLLQMILQMMGYIFDQCFFPVVPLNVSLLTEWALLVGFSLLLRVYIARDIIFSPFQLFYLGVTSKSDNKQETENLSTKDRLLQERLRDLGKYMINNLLLSTIFIYIIYASSGRSDWFYLLFSIANYCHGRFCHVMLLQINEECIRFERATLEEKAKMFENNRTAFVQFVLHEVRVPLSSIMLGLDLINSSENVSTEAWETIEMMRQAANFMKATLNDVLSWQKIEQEGMVLNISSFPPHFLLQTVSNNFRYNLLEKDIKLSINIDGDVPGWVEGDFFRLEHVMANLLSNAIKFSGDKTNIELRCEMANASQLKFTVLDEGIGISESDQAKLFQPYVQINPQKLQGGKGSGLGLSICRKIIDAHNGKIACASRQNCRGSKFFFTIPFKEGSPNFEQFPKVDSGLTIDPQIIRPTNTSKQFAPVIRKLSKGEVDTTNVTQHPVGGSSTQIDKATQVETELVDMDNYAQTFDCCKIKTISCESYDSDSTTACSDSFLTTDPNHINYPFEGGTSNRSSSMSSFSTEAEMKSSHPMFAPINVLVCDDVKANRKILEKVIGPKSLCTDCCEDGSEAIEKVAAKETNFYDVVFMDNLMPNMNGMEASKILRQNKYDGLIVGVTGSAMETEVADFLHSGADLVLSKPLRLDTLNMLLQYCNEFGAKSPTYSTLNPHEVEERLKQLAQIKNKQ